MNYNVFISYKCEDEKFAKGLYDFLQENKLSSFLADKSMSKSDYKNQIDDALENSECLIVISSKANYLNSRWVKYEWDTFLKEILSNDSEEITNKQLFTIIDDKIEHKDLPLSLRNLQYFYLSDYKDKLLPFLGKEIIQPPANWYIKRLNDLSYLKDKFLSAFPIGVIIILIFLILFSVGFGHTHFSERKYNRLYYLANENINLLENEDYGYFLLETEDVFFDIKNSTISFIPKTTQTINIYESKRKEIVKSISFFSAGSLLTTLIKTRIRGNSKLTALLYIGGTVAIISGYGIGHYLSKKRYPAIESDRMKEFLSNKENWETIINAKNRNTDRKPSRISSIR